MSLHPPSPILPTALAEAFHAPGPTTDISEAAESTFRLVDSALGTPAVSLRLLMLDPTGRLRLVAERTRLEDVGRKRSARRREAVVTKRACVIHLRRPVGASLAIVPLVSRGEALGVLEVGAPGTSIDDRLEAFEAIGEQTASLLRTLGTIEEGRRLVEASAGVAPLMRDLQDATSPQQAARIVVRFLWGALEVPVAAWLQAMPGEETKLVATRGIGRDVRSALARSGGEPWEVDALVRSGTDVLGGASPILTSAGDAVVLVSGASEDATGLLETVGACLSLALDRLAHRGVVRELAGSIDAGLAWTAHEIRSPLLGVEKAIDAVTSRERMRDRDRQLLERAQVDLHRLTSTVNDLLRWSVGAASIRRRRTDLVRLVSETLRSLPVLESGRKIAVDLPEEAVVRVDPLLLRIAVANLVRNALQHGDGDVEVTLEATDGGATVSVSDRGQGVPTDELAVMFEPFVRGRRAALGGQGLGLFIAQRVVQAHGGSLWFEAGVGGPVFRMRIPAAAT
ncbi:MAG: GAF domain-containing sensor histidine kinase [Actinomycetota bacterium]